MCLLGSACGEEWPVARDVVLADCASGTALTSRRLGDEARGTVHHPHGPRGHGVRCVEQLAFTGDGATGDHDHPGLDDNDHDVDDHHERAHDDQQHDHDQPRHILLLEHVDLDVHLDVHLDVVHDDDDHSASRRPVRLHAAWSGTVDLGGAAALATFRRPSCQLVGRRPSQVAPCRDATSTSSSGGRRAPATSARDRRVAWQRAGHSTSGAGTSGRLDRP